MGNPLPSRLYQTEGSTSIRLCGFFKAVRCTLAPIKYSERRGIRVQYHEVKLNFTFSTKDFMQDAGVKADTDSDMSVTLWVDYVYLDTDERRRFAQVSHEYLITQVQFTGDETASYVTGGTTQNLRLNLNHPCKYLAWVFANPNKHGHFAGNASSRDVTTDIVAPMDSAKLQLNGHDRFAQRYGAYFNYTQPYQTVKSKPRAGVYMYSFALSPDQHQPSGSCNFSRIDNATLVMGFKTQVPASSNVILTNVINTIATYANTNGKSVEHCTTNEISSLTALRVFAENYNVLRIMSGMGGLAYSN